MRAVAINAQLVRIGTQLWTRCKARKTAVCYASGGLIWPGDDIYRPMTNDRDRMRRIRANALELKDMTNLKPCPFCGHEAEFERRGDRGQSCIVVCTSCGVRHESSDEGAQNGQTWNERSYPVLTDAQINGMLARHWPGTKPTAALRQIVRDGVALVYRAEAS